MKTGKFVWIFAVVSVLGVLLAFADPRTSTASNQKLGAGPEVLKGQGAVTPVQLVSPPVDPVRPTAFNVYTNSMMLAPPRTISGAPAWSATGTYQHGSLVQSNGKLYWNVSQTFTNCTPVSAAGPSHLQGDVADAGGGIIWRRFTSGARQGIDIVSSTDDNCWLAVGYPAVTNNGILLTTRGSTWFMTGNTCQDAVYGVATTVVRVVVQER